MDNLFGMLLRQTNTMKKKLRLAPANGPPMVLSIAGSDCSGGAGVQADLRTFHRYQMHGLSVITAITAQSAHAITAIHPLSARWVAEQLDAVFGSFSVAAVKIGMLGNAQIVSVVADYLRRYQPPNIVLDPVMAASLGGELLTPKAVDAMRKELIPLSHVLTPNWPETRRLLKQPSYTNAEKEEAAQALLALGTKAVLLKGGHAAGSTVEDYYRDAKQRRSFRYPRVKYDARGTGCTLAAAIAAELARGNPTAIACARATRYLHRLLGSAFQVKAKESHFFRVCSHYLL